MEWCRNKFVQLDIQKFEDEQQDVLKKTLSDIDLLEERLKSIDARKEFTDELIGEEEIPFQLCEVNLFNIE